VSAGVALPQLLQQCLGILEVRRVKALSEPAVDGCQEVVGFLAFTLLLPESSQAGRGTEFPGFGLLALGYTDGLMEAGFCFSLIGGILL
jgi:hypothetical protein